MNLLMMARQMMGKVIYFIEPKKRALAHIHFDMTQKYIQSAAEQFEVIHSSSAM